jgi:hypothetical protein
MPNDQPLVARNQFFRAQLDIAEAINGLELNVPPPPQPDIDLTNAVNRVADAIQSLDHSKSDNVVSLYAFAIGPHGGVSDHSDAGRWIQNAWSQVGHKDKPSICDISALIKKSNKTTERFELELRQTREKFDGFVASLTDVDIERFLGLAADVCSKIGSAPAGDPVEARDIA